MTTKEKMVELFKVEELEERMEFGEWTSEGTGDSNCPFDKDFEEDTYLWNIPC